MEEPVPSTVDVTAPAYRSFVVRLWRAASNEWQGEVEHIQSGAHWHFDTLDDTLSFLRRHVEADDQPHHLSHGQMDTPNSSGKGG